MKQVRFIPNVDCGLNVREPQEGQDESRVVMGKPIIFGVRSVNLTPWSSTRSVYEILEPGCISDELLNRSDVVYNNNHSNDIANMIADDVDLLIVAAIDGESLTQTLAEAKDAEYLRSRRPVWRRQGRCQYCGGFFKGGLKGMKVCSMCGMEKDY